MEAAFPRIDPVFSELGADRGPLRVAEIRLGGVPRGAVVVLCGTGALERDAPSVLNGLAEHGYESVAADLTPRGDGRSRTAAGTDLLDDVADLLRRLAERGWSPDQTGLVGYGAGGQTALLAAAGFLLAAAVSVSPSGPWDTPPVRTPWLGLFGATDTPPTAVRSLGERLWSRSPAYTQVVTYPGVAGPFHSHARDALAQAAAFDSWQRTVEWLDLRVSPRPTPLAEAWRKRCVA